MSKKVLIIEDNIDIRENVIEILELASYTVLEAANGKAGIDLAVKEKPDVILCDIMMPELDGYGVLYLLNKQPETKAIPFIFLTAKAERLDLRRGMEMGADDYLTKPFDSMELLSAIESRLNKKEIQQSVYSQSLDRLTSLVAQNDGLAALQKVIAERKTRLIKKNQVIYYEGDKGSGLFLLISGKVKSIKLAADGREFMTGMFSADDYLGINSMLQDEVHSETATAVEDCLVCLIPKNLLEELLNQYPAISRAFIKLLSKDIKEKEEQLLQMAYHSVRKKMAEALLRLNRQEGNAEENSFKASREDMAAMTGMATETVSRTLSDFKDDGLIEKKGSTITIVNFDGLTKMKN